MQEKPFYIKTSHTEGLLSQYTIYVDGTAGTDFREGVDVELSHWIPNRTEDLYKAGTSTEICFKYLEANKTFPYDLVVNNHLDIDGILSVFVLSYPTFALQHKDVLCKVAEAGDFWAWSEGKSLHLFQELTLLYQRLEREKVNLQKTYEDCFKCILAILTTPEEKTSAELLLQKQLTLITEGKIVRQEIAPHFVTYFVPRKLSQGKVQDFLEIPRFNEPISERLSFWPQVRNRMDSQKIQLISIESEDGLYYDLWYPGYAWAETKGLWLPPGLSHSNTGNHHKIFWPALEKVIQELNMIETGSCEWVLFSGFSFSGQENPKGFPIVATTLDENYTQKESHIPLEKVSLAFQKVFERELDSSKGV